MQLVAPEHDASVRLPRYGWAGGLGTLWCSWLEHGAAAVLLTQVLPPSPELTASFVHAMEAAPGAR